MATAITVSATYNSDIDRLLYAVAHGSGAWSFATATLANSHAFTPKAMDAARNLSTASAALTWRAPRRLAARSKCSTARPRSVLPCPMAVGS